MSLICPRPASPITCNFSNRWGDLTVGRSPICQPGDALPSTWPLPVCWIVWCFRAERVFARHPGGVPQVTHPRSIANSDICMQCCPNCTCRTSPHLCWKRPRRRTWRCSGLRRVGLAALRAGLTPFSPLPQPPDPNQLPLSLLPPLLSASVLVTHTAEKGPATQHLPSSRQV